MSLIIRILRKEDPLDRINLWSLKTDTMRETINHTILKYWFPVVLWVGFTILMSTGTFSEENTSRIIEPVVKFFVPAISTHALGILTALIRKLAHLTEYFILSLLLFRAFKGGSAERHAWRWALSSILVVILLAASDEFHQGFEVSRTASMIDVGIDTVGGILGQCARSGFHYVRVRKKSR